MEKAWEFAVVRKIVFVFIAILVATIFSETVSAKESAYKTAPFAATYCYFDGQDCEPLRTFVRVLTVTQKNNASGFKKNEKILSVKTIDAKSSWQKDEILIFREKYKKKYKKALRNYLKFADAATEENKLFPRQKIAKFEYLGGSQSFSTFSRFEDDHYLVIRTSTSRLVLNQKNAKKLLTFIDDWNFEGEIHLNNQIKS